MATAVYENVGGEDRRLIYPSVILACLAVLVIIPVYYFYFKGEHLRLKSKFAQELEIGRRKRMEKRRSTAAGMHGSIAEKGKVPVVLLTGSLSKFECFRSCKTIFGDFSVWHLVFE